MVHSVVGPILASVDAGAVGGLATRKRYPDHTDPLGLIAAHELNDARSRLDTTRQKGQFVPHCGVPGPTLASVDAGAVGGLATLFFSSFSCSNAMPSVI